MVSTHVCVLALWMKVTSVLEGINQRDVCFLFRVTNSTTDQRAVAGFQASKFGCAPGWTFKQGHCLRYVREQFQYKSKNPVNHQKKATSFLQT